MEKRQVVVSMIYHGATNYVSLARIRWAQNSDLIKAGTISSTRDREVCCFYHSEIAYIM